jgi:hypothetical protein
MTAKKLKHTYNREADLRYLAKLTSEQKIVNRRRDLISRAKNFIETKATMQELKELLKSMEKRSSELLESRKNENI